MQTLACGVGLGMGIFPGLGGAADPIAALFANGEQGTYYDPSDLSTLFQDVAGTIPVTADGQRVGLMLDKSKGATLGADIFSDATVTVLNFAGTTATYNPSTNTITNTTSGTSAPWPRVRIDSTAPVAGSWYKIQGVLSGSYAGSLIYFANSNSAFLTIAGNGSFSGYLVSDGSGLLLQTNIGVSTGSIVIESISVQALPGNHATQSVLANRPTYRTASGLHWLEGTTARLVIPALDATMGNGFYAAHAWRVTTSTGNTAIADTFGFNDGSNRQSIGWRSSSGAKIYGVAQLINAETLFSVATTNGAFVEGSDYVSEGWHDLVNVNLRMSTGVTASAPANLAGATKPYIAGFIALDDGAPRFYGGVYRDGVTTAANRTTVREWLASKSDVTLA